MKKRILLFRRWILLTLVPEWFWPKYVIIAGTKIPIRNEPFSFGTKWILKKKQYENAEISLISEIIHRGDIVVEMGTSIGVLTRIISSLIGENGRIVTIECNKELYNSCLRWIKQYSNVTLVEGFGFPIYDAPASLSINGYSDTLGSLGSIVNFSLTNSSQQNNNKVFDLKRIQKLYNINPTVLVIDIEGSEEVLLAVDPCFPLSIQYILIELHEGMYTNNKLSENEIIKVIEREKFVLIKKIHSSYLFSRKAAAL